MSPLVLESICVLDGAPQLLDYHQRRVDRSLLSGHLLDLTAALAELSLPPTGKHKLRLIYDRQGHVKQLEHELYAMRQLRALRLRELDCPFDYAIKWLDRRALDAYAEGLSSDEDVLLLREGFLVEGRYANLALLREGVWYTPQDCLLEGVQRAFLLDTGLLNRKRITIQQLGDYDSIALINAMLPLGSCVLPISSILSEL